MYQTVKDLKYFVLFVFKFETRYEANVYCQYFHQKPLSGKTDQSGIRKITEMKTTNAAKRSGCLRKKQTKAHSLSY